MDNNAAKIVGSAIIGMDFQTVIVNNKAYVIHPPTIKKIAGAGYYLADLKIGNSLKDMLMSLRSMESAAKALSWFIQGDDSLGDELSQGSFDEVVDALEVAYSLISTENFLKLLGLARNVANLTAKQRL
jgi:hypothetical protein|nr:MAG TPA: hypothetical protein [Caudoviricetes sp.]